MTYILAIDQGTTSTRAIVFDAAMQPVAQAQAAFTQHFPAPGLVEHDPADLLATTRETARAAVAQAGLSAGDVAGIGITNQRETTLVWDRRTGAPIYNAIVWQDRRTAAHCDALRDAGHEAELRARTGLVLDPYFSATKLAWILDHVAGARALAEAGTLAFGTVDSFLIWHLTGGAVHATDATNAARTMLYDIHEGAWSAPICAVLGIPMQMLPEVRDCACDFGTTDLIGGAVPILGVAGDQQAAMMGQACFTPGMVKSTYGTGCFALLNTGARAVPSEHRLLTTIAYQLGGQTTYALEGAIFVAGAAVQWLRDGLGVLSDPAEAEALAAAADPEDDVIMVPAFTGLGAPYWNAQSRGALMGLSRGSGPGEITRAALQAVGYQTRDLLDAMARDWGQEAAWVLRVDGGMAASDIAMQFLSDIVAMPVDRAQVLESTGRGAAWLAGMQAGLYPGAAEMAQHWARARRFEPQMEAELRARCYARWQRAVQAVIGV